MNIEAMETPNLTSFRRYEIRHNKYYGNTAGRVYCDPIISEGKQTPQIAEFAKTIGEIAVVTLFSSSMFFSFYMIYALRTGAISW
jgi:hypothetical protein